MLDTLFTGIFETTATLAVPEFLLCLGTALVAGLILALFYKFMSKASGSFLLTLALLPAVVSVIILMVNGNIGTAVAVAGAFSLVRFRSAAGTAREICALFLAMASGLIAGAGYLGYAILFPFLLCLIWFVYTKADLGGEKALANKKVLRITIPESLDYTNVFEDIFQRYTLSHEMTSVKTTDLGALFRTTWSIALKNPAEEKEMIDALRVRNGNLEISVSQQMDKTVSEL